jgi:mannosyltransferase
MLPRSRRIRGGFHPAFTFPADDACVPAPDSSSGARAGAGRLSAFVAAVWREHRMELAVAAILIAAAGVRFASIGDQSLDHDETVTAARVLHPSLVDTMRVVVDGERSPPLYYALAWLWSRPLGTGAVALRSLSAIFGIVTVLAAYLAGRELVGRRAGLVAAALVASNPYLIWYSQEARSYATLVMFGALALWFLARALRRRDRRSLTGWAACSALALCSHYFAVFAIVPEGLWLLASWPRRRPALAACLAVGAVGIALLPLAVIQEGAGRGNGFTAFPVDQRAATAIVKYATIEGPAPEAGIQSTTPQERGVAAVAVGLAALALGLVATRGSSTERAGAVRAASVAAAAFGLPLLLAWAGLDFVDPRNMIGFIVPALVTVAIGFSARRAAAPGGLAAVAVVGLFGFVLGFIAGQPALERHDWRALANVLPSSQRPRLYVVPADGRAPLAYYTGSDLARFLPRRFADGLATRSVIVASDSPRIYGPGRGFHLRATRTAPQHWTVSIYAARRPIPVAPSRVASGKVMFEPSTVLVADPRALLRYEAAADLRSRRPA